MGESVFRKVTKILEKPQEPAYLAERRAREQEPWYQGVADAVLPPAPVPAMSGKLTGTQRRLILGALAVVVLSAAVWVAYSYREDAPTRASKGYEAGMLAQATGDFHGAIAKFSEALAAREDAMTYLQRGNAYKNLGQMEQAADDWSHAIALDGEMAEAYTARAEYFRSKGDMSRAMQDLEHSIELTPSVDSYYQLGELYRSQSRYEIAIQTFSRAIDLWPTAPYVYFSRAEARRATGDEVGADEDLNRGLALLPQN